MATDVAHYIGKLEVMGAREARYDPNKTVDAYKITAETIDPHFMNHADPVEVRRARERVKERLRADGHVSFGNNALEVVHTELLATAEDDTN